MTLVDIVKKSGLSRRELAMRCNCSAGTICNVLGGKYPRTWAATLPLFINALTPYATPAKIEAALKDAAKAHTDTAPAKTGTEEEDPMFLRKQSFTIEARAHFGITRNPFADPQSQEDIYICNETRYVRESLRDAAINGNFLAVIGESGSGKTTLVADLEEWIRAESKPVTIIKPQILALSASEKTGKPLKARDIAEAIILTVQPGVKMPSSNEQMFRKVQEVLMDAKARRHLLLIEEAHELNAHTLKTLKRFWELAEGMRRLLSIALIGQQELEDKLNSTAKEVREVVQRCDVVRLPVLPDIAAFLKFRFARAGLALAELFEPEALDALREKLIVSRDASGVGTNMAYPLAICNLTTRVMNEAAAFGVTTITADVVRNTQTV